MNNNHWVREAKKLVSNPDIAKRVVDLFQPVDQPKTMSPGEVARQFRDLLGAGETEKLGLIAVNRRLGVIGSTVISEGSDAFTIVCPKRIVRWALTLPRSPYAIFMAHNHPSGDPMPSVQDDQITRKVQTACETVGMVLLDHVVLGDALRYVSYASEGKITQKVETVSYLGGR